MKKYILSCLVAVFLLTIAVSAEETYIKINAYNNNTVEFSIDSTVSYDNAIILVSGYAANGQFTGSKMETVTVPVGTYSSSADLTENTASFQVMLLDPTTYAPLCKCGKEYIVTFADKDGNTLTEQVVFAGNAACPPDAPTVEGYAFAGWDFDFTCITEDTTIKPTYVEPDTQNLFTVSSADGTDGEEIKVLVSLGGTVNLSGYDMRLAYDSEVLEFVSLDSEFSMDVVANHVASGGYIRFNYSSRTNRTRAGDIMEVTFRIKEGISAQGTAVRLSPIQVVFVDAANGNVPASCEFTVTEGVIRIQ